MGKQLYWRIKKEYFSQLLSGKKTIEIRVGYPAVKRIQKDDIVTFENYGKNKFLVMRVSSYRTFSEMLEFVDPKSILPDSSKEEVLRVLRKIYPEDKERLGVFAIELRNISDSNPYPLEIIRASDLLKQEKNKEFAKLVSESYLITDWITKDYPDHCDHFFSKYVPGIFSGEREIVVAYSGVDIVAMAALKKTREERKISTLFVKETARGKKIASRLLDNCFQWLGTTKPVATIADYKLDQFTGIIEKYKWEQTSILGKGYYNNHSQEIVFNGYSNIQ